MSAIGGLGGGGGGVSAVGGGGGGAIVAVGGGRGAGMTSSWPPQPTSERSESTPSTTGVRMVIMANDASRLLRGGGKLRDNAFTGRRAGAAHPGPAGRPPR